MSGKDKYEDKVELVLLRSLVDNYEMDLVSGLLEEANIPFIVKERGSGGYMKIIGGSSVFGTDIYVDKEAYEKAEEVLDVIEWDEEEE